MELVQFEELPRHFVPAPPVSAPHERRELCELNGLCEFGSRFPVLGPSTSSLGAPAAHLAAPRRATITNW